MASTSAYAGQRRIHLEALAEQLPDRGLVSRMLGGDDPVLWVWHPHTGRQTIVFATPAKAGWLFLWSPDGQENAEDLDLTADTIKKLLAES